MSVNWKRIIRAIKNEGAILFIGPDIEKTETGEIVYQHFSDEIIKEYEGDVNIDKDGFFFFIDPLAKSDVIYEMKEFYEKYDFATDIYKKIAAMPFHLIISLSPDDAIHNVFDDNGIIHQFKHFDNYKIEVENFTKEEPFIFNLFGLATKGKYILTQEDYFNYIKAIIGDDLLPRKIITALKDAGSYIFVGFDFDKWYNRLLLMILNFHVDKSEKIRHAIQSENTDALMKQLIEKQFNITFIEEDGVDFLSKLHGKLEESKMLRTLTPLKDSLQQQVAKKQDFIETYRDKIRLISDPQETERYKYEIEKLEVETEKLINRLKEL